MNKWYIGILGIHLLLLTKGCYNKVSQTGWNLLSHSYGGWKSKIKVLARLVPSEGCEKESVSCLSPSFGGFPAIFGVSWLVDVSLQSLSSSSHDILLVHFCVQISPFYKDNSQIGLRPNLMTSYWLDYLWKSCIPNKVLVVRPPTYLVFLVDGGSTKFNL